MSKHTITFVVYGTSLDELEQSAAASLRALGSTGSTQRKFSFKLDVRPGAFFPDKSVVYWEADVSAEVESENA